MPRPRLPEALRFQVFEAFAESQHMPTDEVIRKVREAVQIHPRLAPFADALPSPRTVERLRVEWKSLPEGIRALYHTPTYPRSFEDGLLPWSAAPALLELHRYLLRVGQRERFRLHFTRLFIRVSEGIPGAPFTERFKLAQWLMEAAVLSFEAQRPGRGRVAEVVDSVYQRIEAYMAMRPWDSDEARREYVDACTREDAPVPPLAPFTMFAGPWRVDVRATAAGNVSVTLTRTDPALDGPEEEEDGAEEQDAVSV